MEPLHMIPEPMIDPVWISSLEPMKDPFCGNPSEPMIDSEHMIDPVLIYSSEPMKDQVCGNPSEPMKDPVCGNTLEPMKDPVCGNSSVDAIEALTRFAVKNRILIFDTQSYPDPLHANDFSSELMDEPISPPSPTYLNLGAFELYGIQVSGDDIGDVKKIDVEFLAACDGDYDYVSEIIYLGKNHLSQKLRDSYADQERKPKKPRVSYANQERKPKKPILGEGMLPLCGPKRHLTASAPVYIMKFYCKSGFMDHYFSLSNGHTEPSDTVVVKEIACKEVASKFTVSYEWITSAVVGNFQFMFIGEDPSRQYTIHNLDGYIEVSSGKEGMSRKLGLFSKDGILTGTTLPLLRSSAAFCVDTDFTVTCSLTYCVEGRREKMSIASEGKEATPLKAYIVFSDDELKKTESLPELRTTSFFGDKYPKLLMEVLWLTKLTGLNY